MNAKDELRQFHRFLGDRLERGAETTLDAIIAEWRMHQANQAGSKDGAPEIPAPLSGDARSRSDSTRQEMDPYELEHFLEHGHD